MRLVVVHVNAIAVHLFAEAVAGAMNELGAVTRAFDDVSRRPIHFEPAQLTPFACGAFHEIDSGVSSIARRRKRSGIFLRHGEPP